MAKPPEARPDICVIGTDPAGIEIAFAAAGLGVPVMLVTNHPADASPEPAALSLQRLRALGVKTIEGSGSFVDAHRFVAGDLLIRARRYVLATGATPILPAIAGIGLPPIWDARQNAQESGEGHHVLVVGAGPSGMLRASTAHMCGCKVTVLAEQGLLDDFDAEAVDVLRPEFERRGIQIREHVGFKDALVRSDNSSGFTITFSEGPGPISFTHVIFDCGLAPAFDGLGLDKAGLHLTDGKLTLGKGLRTGNRRIYVAGDASGMPASGLHTKTQSGAILGEILFRKTATLDPALMSRLTLTSPAIAEIGLREREIKPGQTSRFRFYRVSLSETAGHQTKGSAGKIRAPAGQIKVIAAPNGLIRGVSILAEDAAELIVPFTLAMAKGIPLHDLAQLPIAAHGHAEAISALARQALADRVRTPGSLRLMRFLRIFG